MVLLCCGLHHALCSCDVATVITINNSFSCSSFLLWLLWLLFWVVSLTPVILFLFFFPLCGHRFRWKTHKEVVEEARGDRAAGRGHGRGRDRDQPLPQEPELLQVSQEPQVQPEELVEEEPLPPPPPYQSAGYNPTGG